MKLTVSNIAWRKEEEPEIAALLQDLGVKHVEVAPTKQWDNPTAASSQELAEYSAWWRNFGIEVVAFQSMLFNRPDLKLFESIDNRVATAKYLSSFIEVAATMGAKIMVFGSPKNRQKGLMPEDAANDIAAEFFGELGRLAYSKGVDFCIEPNAPQYACDFVSNAQSGIELVKRVNTPGFGLHLDIACMTLAGDNVPESITAASNEIKHFHISSPMLEDVVDRPDVNHREAAEALRAVRYNRYVSIEMRPVEGSNLNRVRDAVTFAQKVYHP